MLAQRTFRPCQGTERWPHPLCGYCPSKMFLYGKLIAGRARTCIHPHYGAFLPIRRPRVPEVNYSPVWCLPVDRLIPYVNTLTNLAVGFDPTVSRSTSGTATIPVNVFAYGRGTGIRTLTWRIKSPLC